MKSKKESSGRPLATRGPVLGVEEGDAVINCEHGSEPSARRQKRLRILGAKHGGGSFNLDPRQLKPKCLWGEAMVRVVMIS